LFIPSQAPEKALIPGVWTKVEAQKGAGLRRESAPPHEWDGSLNLLGTIRGLSREKGVKIPKKTRRLGVISVFHSPSARGGDVFGMVVISTLICWRIHYAYLC
jgi:hypothetical protein